MHIKLQLLFVMTLVVGFVTTSQQIHGNTTRENLVEITPEPTTREGGSFISFPLTCPKDIVAYPGLSWRGIILGQSMLSDIEDVYGVIANRDDYADSRDANVYGISITQKASRERRLAGSVEVCVTTGWRIAVLAISVDFNDDVLPTSLEYWVQRLGVPDIVTWSNSGWSYRDVVWSKSGLGLEVLIRGNIFDLIHDFAVKTQAAAA